MRRINLRAENQSQMRGMGSFPSPRRIIATALHPRMAAIKISDFSFVESADAHRYFEAYDYPSGARQPRLFYMRIREEIILAAASYFADITKEAIQNAYLTQFDYISLEDRLRWQEIRAIEPKFTVLVLRRPTPLASPATPIMPRHYSRLKAELNKIGRGPNDLSFDFGVELVDYLGKEEIHKTHGILLEK